MVLILETGAGTPGANTYMTVAFITAYLTNRNRETENLWSTASLPVQEAGAIAATDYIEKRWSPRFKATRLRDFIDGRLATGAITFTANPVNAETVTVGLIVYRMVTVLAQENDVLIGATLDDSTDNLVAAGSSADGAGTTYSALTRFNFEAQLTKNEDDPSILDVTASNFGENANEILLATTVTGATASGATLLNGLDSGPQPLSFPKVNLFTPKGEAVIGVPLNLKKCGAEYAVRSLAAVLAPDPLVDDTLARVQSKTDKVGPITEIREFAEGAVPEIFKDYPAADELLADYITSSGGAFR